MADALSPTVAESLLRLKPNEAVLTRVTELAAKSNSGQLSEAELDEYRSLADAETLVALLKAKARRFLAQHPSRC